LLSVNVIVYFWCGPKLSHEAAFTVKTNLPKS